MLLQPSKDVVEGTVPSDGHATEVELILIDLVAIDLKVNCTTGEVVGDSELLSVPFRALIVERGLPSK